MTPGRSDFSLGYELNTQESLYHILGAYIFLTLQNFIIHRQCDADVNAPQLLIFDLPRARYRIANGVEAVLFSNDLAIAAANKIPNDGGSRSCA